MDPQPGPPVPVEVLDYQADGGSPAEALATVVRGMSWAVAGYAGLTVVAYGCVVACYRWHAETVPAGRRVIDGATVAAGAPTAALMLAMLSGAIRCLRWDEDGRRQVVASATTEAVLGPLTVIVAAVYMHHVRHYAAYGSAFAAYAMIAPAAHAAGVVGTMIGVRLFYRQSNVRRLFMPGTADQRRRLTRYNS